MYVYKYVVCIYVYTYIIICMLIASLLRMIPISARLCPAEEPVEPWASFPELCIYYVPCDRTGRSPTSHMAFVVEIPHPVTVKSC